MGIRGRRWLAATCLLLTAAACSGDDDDGGNSSVITDPPRTTSTTERSTTTTETTIDPQADVKAEVEAAYLAYWDAWLEIGAAPNPENPLIERHTTGAVREVTLDRTSDHILHGRSVRPPDDPRNFRATVMRLEVAGESADVVACLIDGSVLVDNATGNAINDEVATYLLEAKMQVEDGVWKVAQSTIVEERDGRWTCE